MRLYGSSLARIFEVDSLWYKDRPTIGEAHVASARVCPEVRDIYVIRLCPESRFG